MAYYLDLSYYHTNHVAASALNWSLVDHEISEETMRTAGYFDHGFLPGNTHYFFDAPSSRSDTCATLRDNIRQCYIDLLEYVSSQDVSILLVESPFVPLENDVEEMNTLLQLAEEYHVPVLNTNEYTEEMGLDYRTDFYDTNHVNILGAEKYTKFMAEYLAENYDLPDHRNDDQYAEKWGSAYTNYETEAAKLREQTWKVINGKEETVAKEKAIRETEDPLEWLAMTNDPNLVLLFDKRKIDGTPSHTFLAAVKDLGLSSEILSSKNDYIGVYSGSLLYAGDAETAYSGSIDLIWDTMDDVPYSIENNTIHVGESEFKTEQDGISFVIVDKNTREIVDYSLLEVNSSGELVLLHLAV